MTANQWLTNHLIEQGYITEHRIGRTAQHRHCRKCQQPIITGLDSHVAALLAECDPTPLTNQTEVDALRNNQRTYKLEMQQLHPRYNWDIKGTPANNTTVLAQHQCPNPANKRTEPTT